MKKYSKPHVAFARFEMRGETVGRRDGVFAGRVRFELTEEFKVSTEAPDADATSVGFVPNAVGRRIAIAVLVLFIFSFFLFRRRRSFALLVC